MSQSSTCFRLLLFPFCFATWQMAAGMVTQQVNRPLEPWLAGVETAWESNVTEETVREVVEQCRLSEEQQQSAWRVLHDHLERFQSLVERGRLIDDETARRVAELNRGTPAHHFQMIERARLLAPLADEQADLDERALDELGSLILDDQTAAWTRFLQEYHRRIYRTAPLYNEERVDVFALLPRLKISPNEATEASIFEQVCATFAEALDQALVQRYALALKLERSRWKVRLERTEVVGDQVSLGGPVGTEYAKFESNWRRLRDLHRQVRTLNREYIERIADLLPPDRASELRAEYKRAARPELFDGAWMLGAGFSKKALSLADLSEEQRAAIDSAALGYATKRDSLNEQILRAEDEEVR